MTLCLLHIPTCGARPAGLLAAALAHEDPDDSAADHTLQGGLYSSLRALALLLRQEGDPV